MYSYGAGVRWTPFNCSVFTFTDEANSVEAEVGVEMSHSTEHFQVCTVRSCVQPIIFPLFTRTYLVIDTHNDLSVRKVEIFTLTG